MEPPPLPFHSGRFRLRVQIYPQEAYNLNAAPLRQFTIVKTPVLALPDLTLQELCDEVVKRFKFIYPGESLFAIDKPQDSFGFDLYLGDRVRDVFEDNEVFRVIKGTTIRASVEPHRARSQSVQPIEFFQYGPTGPGKRSYSHSATEESTGAQKRQRIVTNDPDYPVHSRERDIVERDLQVTDKQVREATVIQDSQKSTTEGRVGQGVNGLSPRITKSGQRNSSQARQGGSVDRQHSNSMISPSGFHQRISSPSSIASSKDEAATSDSDAHLPRSKAISSSKRKLNLTDDSSERDRGCSISTAMTTPQSVLQQPKNQSPMIDNKKLRRPTARSSKYNTADEQISKVLPRQNVYEVIETDTERPSVKPVSQDVLSKISNSNKWKTYRSSTTSNCDKSSPQQRRSIVAEESTLEVPEDKRPIHKGQQQTVEQKQNQVAKLVKQRVEQDRSRLAFEAAERRRLDAEQEEKEREAKLEIERVAAEKARKIEAKKAQEKEEAEATRRSEALVKAEAVEAAQLVEKARREAEANARLEEEEKSRLEEEERAREASDSDNRRLVIEALRQAEEENDLREQVVLRSRLESKQKSQSLRASLNATVRCAASTPAKGAAAHACDSPAGATPHANGITSANTANPAAASNKRVTCTPFIPRGQISDISPASLHLSQALIDPLPRVPSPNVGLEDQMPMPPQLKRKVSFVDQTPPSARRSSSTSSSLKQTTLVPPRLGITDVKSTPKRTPLKATASGSKLSKGKAKVVESPGKPPPPTIEISSDEESTTNSGEPAIQHKSFKHMDSPGPAYQKSAASQVLSPPKSQSAKNIIELDMLAEHRRNVNLRGAQKEGEENLYSPQNPFANPVSFATQDKSSHSTAEPSSSRIRFSNLSTTTPTNHKAPQSKKGSSSQLHSSSEVVKTPQASESKQVDSDPPERERSVPTNDSSEDELDSIDTPDALKSIDIPSFASGDQDNAKDLKSDQSETTDDDEEESGSDEMHSASPYSSIQQNQQDNSINYGTDIVKQNTNEEFDEQSDDMEAEAQDDLTEEELEEYSDATQAQVDDQLLTQSFENSSFQQASSIPETSKVLPATPKDIGLLQNHGNGRPSLRRMNLEAQRTKDANLQAAKSRGLEKAQKLHDGAKKSGLLEESSEEDLSSLSSSTSSEFEHDDEPVLNTRSNKSKGCSGEENYGDLNNDDVEEMSEQLLAKNGPSSTRASAFKSPSKGSDFMFQPTSMLHHNGDEKDGKKSTKIGWAKLGKQFSASKHKTGV